MDAKRFDQLARTLSATGPRRTLLRLLSVLPMPGSFALLASDEESAAKRRKKQKPKGKKQRIGGENHKHEHRRRKHNLPHKHKHKHKHDSKKTKCKPESVAQTCDGQCGTARNNCQKSVDCGSCACDPACPVCQTCNPESIECEADPAQVGEVCGDGLVCQADGSCACQGDSCGGCRACEGGACVPDPSVVCTPSDQCHEPGVCNPETGACTNPRKEDGTSCDDGDPCTQNDACQNGVCTGGTVKDCSSEDDVCNVGVCRSSDGACIKQPRADGAGCNADNTDCTSGDSCQNGVCMPGGGIDCRAEDDQCNRGVCRQSDGVCIKEPRADGTVCNDGDACTQLGACQSGSCLAGPALVCGASDECHLAGTCNPSTGFCSDPVAPDGTPCGVSGECMAGECVEICLTTNAACDPENDNCCGDEGEFCADFAACASGGEGRCCRDEGAFCTFDCDCCAGVCAGGVCCLPLQQCNVSSDCCEGYNCIDNVCEAVCGTAHAFCGDGPDDFPCCDGYRCFDGECWPNNCLALTETCTGAGECCQDGVTNCAVSRDTFPDMGCCKAHNQTCQETEECCGVDVCSPQGRCCRPGYNDPERSLVRGCGTEGGCCPGWKCNPFSDACCAREGEPVPPGGVLDCCSFTAEDGVCVCYTDGQQCSNPGGNPYLSNCCDGLICVSGECQPPCGIWISGQCNAQFPCCRGDHCNEFNTCDIN